MIRIQVATLALVMFITWRTYDYRHTLVTAARASWPTIKKEGNK